MSKSVKKPVEEKKEATHVVYPVETIKMLYQWLGNQPHDAVEGIYNLLKKDMIAISQTEQAPDPNPQQEENTEKPA